MEPKKKSHGLRNGIIAVVVLAILIGGFVVINRLLSKKGTEGAKTVDISITHLDGTTKDVTLHTDAEYLGPALEEENLIKGETGQYGMFITEMDGEAADEAQQQWWGFTKSGEYVETGIDSTPIADGDHYEFTLNVGY